MSSSQANVPHASPYRAYKMPRTRYPHLPTKNHLYEGIRPPSSKKTLLTVNQINQFYDSGTSPKNTRWRLRKAGLEPVAFGPMKGRSGQPPMLFKAGDAQRALAFVDAPDRLATASSTTLPPLVQKALPESRYYSNPVTGDLGTLVVEEVPAPPVPAQKTVVPCLPQGAEITFNAVVDDESCDEVLQKIMEAVEGGAKDIILWISSEGGSLFTALGLYDRLRYVQRTHGVTLHTVATGYVLSAGTILLAAGEHRYALPHTIFMLHEPYQMPWERHGGEETQIYITEIAERQELHELSIAKLAHLFYERDQRANPEAEGGEEAWLDFFKVPAKKYFGATEAFLWGIVDQIL